MLLELIITIFIVHIFFFFNNFRKFCKMESLHFGQQVYIIHQILVQDSKNLHRLQK